MSDHSTDKAATDLGHIALEKLGRVLGPGPGRHAYEEALATLGLKSVATAQDLYDVGEALSKRDGMAAAVGGLICVAAVLRGATRR